MPQPENPGTIHRDQDASTTIYAASFGSAENFFAALSKTLGARVSFLDSSERVVYANFAFAKWHGYTPEDIVGLSLKDIYGTEAYNGFAPKMHRALAGEIVRYEREHRHHSGAAYWISVDLQPYRGVDGRVEGVFTSSLEVDELKRTRDALEKELQVQALQMANSPLAVIEWGGDIVIRRWSGQAETIFGWSAADVVGRRADEISLVHPDWYPTIRASTLELLEGGVLRNRMISRNLTKSGRYIYCEWYNSAFLGGDGKTRGIFSLAQDVTLRVEAEEQLRYAAVHDALTGLQNRQSLIARLHHALARVVRSGEPLALLFVDLDNFKAVNDTYGHAAGDEFLRQVATRLKSCIRDADTVARIGGDEFVVLLESELEANTPEGVKQRISNGFAQGFTVGEIHLEASASVGISRHPADGSHADHLLASADRAMYRAKQAR